MSTTKTLKITYLTPTESYQKTSKTFTAPKEKSSDYSLGKYFTYTTEDYSSLAAFAFDLSSKENQIIISGAPTEAAEFDIFTRGSTRRANVKFDYPDDQTLHCFDIDGWVIGGAVRESTQAKLTDPESMATLINQMLRNEGFGLLADASKVIVLTSSQWDLQTLNCHLYFNFSNSITIPALREFTIALSKINQRTVFDPAIYKAVQPQFFTAPTCVGFTDPLQGKRVFYHQGHYEDVPLQDFEALVHKTLKNADWSPQAKNSELPSIGISWIDTIQKLVGDERGINEPSYRAAAQLVQEIGRNNVLSNLDSYAQQMFDAVWRTLNSNGSDRGQSQKDRQTYDLARFRQYLESATQKNFGAEVDVLVDQVQGAIKEAKEGNLMSLTSSPAISALCTLRASHRAQFIALKTEIKNSRTLSLGDLKDLMKSGGHSLDNANGTNTPEMTFSDDGPAAENMLIDKVINQYEMIRDTFGNKYAQVPGNGDGGYRMMRVDGALVNVFYVDGLMLSGDQVGPHFGKKAMAKLLGRESKAITSTFEEKLIGTRIVSEDMAPGAPTWINLGMQADGIFRTARLDAEGIEIMTHQDTEIRWMFDTPPLYLATNEQLEERFGSNADLQDYLKETLPKFIATDDQDLNKIFMWLCSVFSDKTLSYIIELTGIAAAGKSTAADFLKDLVDPSRGLLGTGSDRTLFSNASEGNFIADIEQRHVTVLDNVSKLTTKSQDILCSVSTGLRQSERILYTQEQMERTVRRPLIITTLSPVITRPDLRSRVVTVGIHEAKFNRDFLDEWTYEKPFLVAAIMQLTSRAMMLHQNVTHKPSGIGTRDIFLACVSSAIEGKDVIDYDYVLNERLFDAWNMADDVGFVKLMMSWMAEEFGDREVCYFSSRGLVTKLRRWVGNNVGMELDGVTITLDMVPDTGSGLGWQLSKYLDTISKISDWEYDGRKRVSNGHRYYWKRKTNELEALL